MGDEPLIGLDVAQAAYLALLMSGPDYRTHVQHELCLLRDYIAQETDRDPEDIQNLWEAKADALQKSESEGDAP